MLRLFLAIWFPTERNNIVANIEKTLNEPINSNRLLEEINKKIERISLMLKQLDNSFSPRSKKWIEDFSLLKSAFESLEIAFNKIFTGGKVD